MNANTLNTTHTTRLEALLARLLRHGTWCATAVTALGLALAFIEARSATHWLSAPSGMTVVTAGIALLILLPVLRVTLMLIVFVWEHDYVFGVIAATVLAIIILGTTLGVYLPAHTP